MKKVTLLTLSDYGGTVLEKLGEAGVVQLKEISSEYSELLMVPEKKVNYNELREKLRKSYSDLLGFAGVGEPVGVEVATLDFRRLWDDPEGVLDSLLARVNGELDALKREREEEQRKLEEADKERKEERRKLEEARLRLNEERVRLALLRSLNIKELKKCLLAGIIKEVSPEYSKILKGPEEKINYDELRKRLDGAYSDLLGFAGVGEPVGVEVATLDFRRLWDDPEGVLDSLLARVNGELDALKREREEEQRKLEEAKHQLNEERVRLVLLRFLNVEELKKCLLVGIVKVEALPWLEAHLKRLGDTTYRVESVSPGESFIFIFGPEERKPWIETLFYVLGIRDIFDVLGVRDTLLALNPELREDEIKRREEDLKKYLKASPEDLEAIQKKEAQARLLPLLREVKSLNYALGVLSEVKSRASEAKLEMLPWLEAHLKRLGDTTYRVESVSPGESFIFIFGPEERKPWIETLFYVLGIRDIFDVLGVRDTLLALNPELREDEIKRREESLLKQEEELEKYIEASPEGVEEVQRKEAQARVLSLLKEMRSLDYTFRVLSEVKPLTLESKPIYLLQGWISEKNLPIFEQKMEELRRTIGDFLVIQYEPPSHDDVVPTDAPSALPRIFRPSFTLTSLRGWPSAHEINPALITILVFSFQFGLMFGDVGQGLIFLIMGFVLNRKYKRGMMSKLGVMFIPMGISAIAFGFIYGSFFLNETLLEHIRVISPIEETGRLMKTVLAIGVIELVLGLTLGAINEYKSGHPIGAIGEHGLGGILSIVGLYLAGLYFLQVGNIFIILSDWRFMMLAAGLVLSFVEPVISSVRVHRKLGVEAFGGGIGGFLMVFVESLSNFFSFLRIAAFALAHASLAVAARAMQSFMGPAGYIMMNVIAMSFEFISSSVQSLRLLYYEFMGKFFHGGGMEFRPFYLITERADKE
jgi:vacuolar-type H+-ATPase subunit I/STV1